jgi:hypothetical protein
VTPIKTPSPDVKKINHCPFIRRTMRNKLIEKRNITTEQAIEVLARNGMVVSAKKAEEILDLMYFLAKLIVKQNFKK